MRPLLSLSWQLLLQLDVVGLLLVVQVDVTARVAAEKRIAEVLEAEHKLLEGIFLRCGV